VSKAPIWPVATDALIADTTHLTTEEFGAYMLLMMAQWRSNGAALPLDEKRLARIARLSPRAWEKARPALVDLFEVSAGGWSQKRVKKDLVGVIEKIEANRVSGSLGGKAKALKTKNAVLADATASPAKQASENVAIHEPYPEPDKKEDLLSAGADPLPPPKPRSERKTYPEAFEAFWRDYPTDPNMSKKAAAEKWVRLSPEDRAAAQAAIPAFKAYCQKRPDYRPVHAERFLSQRRFDGFLDASRPAASGDLPAAPDWGDPGQKLIEAIGAPVFAQWFGGGAVELITGDPVRIVADKPYRRNWIAKNYQGALAHAFGTDVVIECNDNRTSDGRTIR
jgi:uncharacterized protein YdaU (DUF1376 family)